MSGSSKTRVRKHEYFKCGNCSSEWEGQYILDFPKSTKPVLNSKKCKKCKTMCEPYLRCSKCLLQDCMCEEDKADKQEHKLPENSKTGDQQNRDDPGHIPQKSGKKSHKKKRKRSYPYGRMSKHCQDPCDNS